MLNIPIDDKYSITSDERNFILSVRKTVKSGKEAGQERLYAVSFHSDLKSLLEKYFTVTLLESDCKSFRELIDKAGEVKGIIAGIQKQKIAGGV